MKSFENGGGAEEIGELGDDESEESGGGSTEVGGRGKNKKKGLRPGGGEEGEEWETASETSLEEREQRSKATISAPSRGRGGGGRGGRGQGTGGFWEGKGRRGGSAAGGAAPGGQEVKEGCPEPRELHWEIVKTVVETLHKITRIERICPTRKRLSTFEPTNRGNAI